MGRVFWDSGATALAYIQRRSLTYLLFLSLPTSTPFLFYYISTYSTLRGIISICV